MKKSLIALAVAIVITVTGCSPAGQSGAKSSEATTTLAETKSQELAGQKSEEYGEVVIQNGDRTITFTSMPQKVLCCNLYSAENMVMLGLKDYIAGKSVPASKAETPLAELSDEFASIPEIEVSHENAVALETDLVIGQISSFQESKWGSYEMFGNKGINSYTITGTLVKDETIENVYTDIENLGKIFKVEDRASSLIDQMKQEISDIQTAVSGIDETNKVKVFVMDTFKGNEIYTTSAGLQSNLIELAGGINCTRNMAESRWFNTSVETIVKTNPDVIIFNDYGQQTMEEKMDFIHNNPALADVTAVKNKAYLTVPLVTVMQDVRATSACRSFAEFFYPEQFKK